MGKKVSYNKDIDDVSCYSCTEYESEANVVTYSAEEHLPALRVLYPKDDLSNLTNY